MPTIQNPGARTSEGSISYADVLHVLGAEDPHRTNAGVLRERLGRGSQATIQRHLDAIRAELAAQALPAPAKELPMAPVETMQALWAAAYTAAEVKTFVRLERLATERDALVLRVSTQSTDLEAAALAVDQLRGRVVELESKAVADAATSSAALAVLEVKLSQASEVNEALKVVLERTQIDAAHAAQVAEKDHTIERQTLQGVIERQQEMLAQLRSLQIVAATEKAVEKVAENVADKVIEKPDVGPQSGQDT